ncbi:E3 ubiquitin-protein ligase ATL59-like isoform X2 [Malania oleifera]|uniref:E3 ubiquitin-protein ligase ATL59-like isoform X2 n=1 Tax=Malania oleifera TaxID=397392 RepID=UPI0025AE046D|nr:E3 ubiquitin-protein ligase ATL59-like isoform X2 [Malania oleifera]
MPHDVWAHVHGKMTYGHWCLCGESCFSGESWACPIKRKRETKYYHPREVGLKGDLKDKLPIVLFDEDLRAKDSQCSVCLKEFEMKEELHQLPSCKHVFHIDCIHHWLHSNSTCPLCRSLVIPHPTTKHEQIREQEAIVDHHQVRSLSSTTNFTGSDEQNTIQIGHQGSISSLRESPAGRMGDELGCPDRESVVLHIQTHTSS